MTTCFKFTGLHILHEEASEGTDDFQIHAEGLIQHNQAPPRAAFNVVIVSPRYLVWQFEQGDEDFQYGRGLIIVRQFDRRRIDAELSRLVAASGATTWEDLRRVMERYFAWID